MKFVCQGCLREQESDCNPNKCSNAGNPSKPSFKGGLLLQIAAVRSTFTEKVSRPENKEDEYMELFLHINFIAILCCCQVSLAVDENTLCNAECLMKTFTSS